MHILIFLQQSVYSTEPKWVTADSGIQMILGLIRHILILDPAVRFSIVISPIEDFCDIKSFDELLSSDRVTFIERPIPISAFYGRIHFDVDWYDKKLSIDFLKTVDVIVQNEPCLARNLKTWLHFKGVKIPMVVQNFWMDCPTLNEAKVDISISYDFRQIDGVLCSDLAVFTCESTRQAFISNFLNRYGTGRDANSLLKLPNETIWDMGFDAHELNVANPPKFERKTILFPNRMSSINYTHHLEFIEAIKILSEMRSDFDVIFCNPSGKIEWKWLEDNVPNLRIFKRDVLTREEYISLLWKCHVGVSLYTMERYGGCANVEMLYCGLKVVMPKVFEYAQRGGDGYPFYCEETLDPEDIAQTVHMALDLNYSMTEVAARVYNCSSYQIVAKKVMKDLEELVKRYANQ